MVTIWSVLILEHATSIAPFDSIVNASYKFVTILPLVTRSKVFTLDSPFGKQETGYHICSTTLWHQAPNTSVLETGSAL